MSQYSHASTASTVPFELSQNQDETFILELELVNELYFNNNFDQSVDLVPDSDTDSFNDDDDFDDSRSLGYRSNDDNDGVDVIVSNERFEDTDALRKQNRFKEECCGCNKIHSKPCSKMFNIDDAISFREYCLELSREELDIVIKAELFNHRQSGESTSSSKHVPKERQRPTQLYFFKGSGPCSLDGKVHYSWDYAQQVNYPHHSRQVGPMYFKTPRKCYVFGICCEGSGKQVFYLTDEGHSPGKCANGVISYVHHYLNQYSLGEKYAVFNFDNCAGQNKNNPVLWYAPWRTSLDLHEKNIEYNLMIAGHTKFSPDWHFGLWKSKWRFCDAETMEDIARTVQLSSKSGHNIPHLTKQDQNAVPFYNWKFFLGQYFKPLKNISKYHIFRMSSIEPGVVYCHTTTNSRCEKFSILKAGAEVQNTVVYHPLEMNGLDCERQLFEHVREFCHNDGAKYQVAPEPTLSKSVCGAPSSKKTKKQKTSKMCC